jgi:hypothetical protein
MQPVSEELGPLYRSSAPHQNEEDRLKGVLGSVAVAHYLAADMQDHRPVTPDERREGELGPLVAIGDELRQ